MNHHALCMIDGNGFGSVVYAAGADLERYLLEHAAPSDIDAVWRGNAPEAEQRAAPGLLVWDGDVLEDDQKQPVLRGEWRGLTPEEFTSFQQQQRLWPAELGADDIQHIADEATIAVVLDFLDELADLPHTPFICTIVSALYEIAEEHGIDLGDEDVDHSNAAE